MAAAVARPRWGDTLDEDDVLPPPTLTGPDGRGIKTLVEWKKNGRGETVKVTTKTRVSKIEKKLYKVRGSERERGEKQEERSDGRRFGGGGGPTTIDWFSC